MPGKTKMLQHLDAWQVIFQRPGIQGVAFSGGLVALPCGSDQPIHHGGLHGRGETGFGESIHDILKSVIVSKTDQPPVTFPKTGGYLHLWSSQFFNKSVAIGDTFSPRRRIFSIKLSMASRSAAPAYTWDGKFIGGNLYRLCWVGIKEIATHFVSFDTIARLLFCIGYLER